MATLDDIRKKTEETIGSIRPEDVTAGAELASEAVADAVGKVAADLSNITPEELPQAPSSPPRPWQMRWARLPQMLPRAQTS